MSHEQGAQLDVWDSQSIARSWSNTLASFIDKTLAIMTMELRKMRHDLTSLFMRVLQPLLWLIIYGEAMTRARAIPTGNLPYLDFITPGILAQSGLFIAIFGGITVIWERDLGIIHKFIASPAPREALALGKALSGGVRAMGGAAVIYVVAALLGVHMNWDPLAIIAAFLTVFLAAALFYSLSLCVAFLVKTRDRMMGIGQLMTMPFFFSSAALYPASVMPRWLQAIAHGNPLSYEVDALRALMLSGGTSTYGLWLDYAVICSGILVLVLLAGRLYPRAAT